MVPFGRYAARHATGREPFHGDNARLLAGLLCLDGADRGFEAVEPAAALVVGKRPLIRADDKHLLASGQGSAAFEQGTALPLVLAGVEQRQAIKKPSGVMIAFQARDCTRTNNVMAKNLLEWLPDLTEKERNEIVYAVNIFGPPRYRVNPLRYNDPASVGLLDREDVIAALHKVHGHYATAAALDLARKLEGEPPVAGGTTWRTWRTRY